MPSTILDVETGPSCRSVTSPNLEIRKASTDLETETVNLAGYAALFNVRTWIGPKRFGFWEEVAPGAFARTLSNNADVRLLINHDDMPLARTASGTLRLSEDKVGLAVDADLDPTDPDVQRLIPKMKRGDVTQMSYGFEVLDEDREQMPDGSTLRIIKEAKLWDVSVVAFPATEQTSVALRSIATDVLCYRLGISTAARAALIAGLAEPEISEDTEALLRSVQESLTNLTSASGSAESTRYADGPSAESTGTSLDVLKRRHALRARALLLP